MVVSVHTAKVGLPKALPLLRRPVPPGTPGLRYAEAASAVKLGRRLPVADLRRVFVIASWDNDAALDAFLGSPAAEALAGGWHMRLQPTRLVGAWPEMPGLPEQEIPMEPGEPAVVLTLGRPRKRRLRHFQRTSHGAERLAVEHPALVKGTALARGVAFVATCTIWRRVDEMRDYAVGRPDKRHLNAIREENRDSFHHRSAFVRFRPYAAAGTWDGLTALGDLRQAPVQPVA